MNVKILFYKRRQNRETEAFSVELQKGQVTAIVGPTESGKSRLLALLVDQRLVIKNGGMAKLLKTTEDEKRT